MYGLIALNFIIPFVMVFVGYILKKHPVKDMTSGNGYNTPTSRKSQEHWDYAQSIAPNIFIGIGKTLGLVEIRKLQVQVGHPAVENWFHLSPSFG